MKPWIGRREESRKIGLCHKTTLRCAGGAGRINHVSEVMRLCYRRDVLGTVACDLVGFPVETNDFALIAGETGSEARIGQQDFRARVSSMKVRRSSGQAKSRADRRLPPSEWQRSRQSGQSHDRSEFQPAIPPYAQLAQISSQLIGARIEFAVAEELSSSVRAGAWGP